MCCGIAWNKLEEIGSSPYKQTVFCVRYLVVVMFIRLLLAAVSY